MIHFKNFIILFLLFIFGLFWAYKEHTSFKVEDGKFLGWEDFSPELIKKFIIEIFGHVGSFSGNLVFS